MSTFDPYLAEQLDRLSPQTTATGDWSDVVKGAKRRRRQRRMTLAIIGAVVVSLAFVGVASAVHYWIFTPGSMPQPAPGTQVTLHAETIVGGKPWAVQSFTDDRGRLCLGIKTPTWKGLSCTTREALFSEGPLAIEDGWTSEGGTPASWLWGVTEPTVKRVIVQFADCSTRSVALDADGYFLVVTPGPAGQAAVQRVTALDDSGQVIGSKIPVTARSRSSDCPTP